MSNLLCCDVHLGLIFPSDVVDSAIIKGKYEFYHYMVDGVDDRGWGCGYRTLQTLCSWVCNNLTNNKPPPIPSLLEIQETLAKIGDKPRTFVTSKDWIGSFEVCLCIDEIYGISSKIIHVTGGDRIEQDAVSAIFNHIKEFGSPVMIGGDIDASSKTLLGICNTEKQGWFFLIADPHFCGKADQSSLQSHGWVQWKQQKDIFKPDSFYNFCLPQLKYNLNR